MLFSPDPDDHGGDGGPDGPPRRGAFARAHDAVEDDFAASLLDPERPVPAGVVDPEGRPAPRRFAVYRNNVVVGLIEALGAAFPAVRRIVGEPFFRALARAHALQAPPTSPLMAEHGREFPGFLRTFRRVADLPYLPDVARIERAWLDSYHAADAAPLAPEALGAVPPERLEAVRFSPHPAAHVIRSRFAAVSIVAMNRSDGPITPLDTRVPEDALVTRPSLEVRLAALPPGGAAFLLALMGGRTLGEAAAAGAGDDPAFDLAANIGGMLGAGAFTAIVPPDIPDDNIPDPDIPNPNRPATESAS